MDKCVGALKFSLVFLDISNATLLISNPFDRILSARSIDLIRSGTRSTDILAHRPKRLISNDAIFDTRRGNSIASIPFKMML